MTAEELINQYVTAHADNRWMDASELEALLTEFAEKLQEPASEGLEKYKEFVATELPQGSKVSQSGEFTIDVLKALIKDAVKLGAHWQREQMMKDAIEGRVTGMGPLTDGNITDPQKKTRRLSATYSFENTPYCELGDKVKAIIINE